MKKLIRPIVFTLALTSIAPIVIAQCVNMAGSNSDVAQQCINCAAQTLKANGTGCSYTDYNCDCTTDCSAGNVPQIVIDPAGGGQLEGVNVSALTFSGGTCSGGSCNSATRGTWTNIGNKGLWTSIGCGG
jgi:hypothetical protein